MVETNLIPFFSIVVVVVFKYGQNIVVKRFKHFSLTPISSFWFHFTFFFRLFAQFSAVLSLIFLLFYNVSSKNKIKKHHFAIVVVIKLLR